MSRTPDLSRRNLVKLLGGAPLFPLAAGASTAMLTACGGGGGDSASGETSSSGNESTQGDGNGSAGTVSTVTSAVM